MRKVDNIFVEKIWGGREIGNTFGFKLPRGKKIGEYWAFYKKNHPLVLKIIDAQKPLSVQVHPTGKKPKNEVWYILSCGKEARALGGINLEQYKINPGVFVYIPAGTVHTIMPPALIFEVSQNNLTTYRLYDWGRKSRGLDIEEGIKVIKLKNKPIIYRGTDKFNCPFFKILRKELKEGQKINFNGICFVLNGAVTAQNKIIEKGKAEEVDGFLRSFKDSTLLLVSQP